MIKIEILSEKYRERGYWLREIEIGRRRVREIE